MIEPRDHSVSDHLTRTVRIFPAVPPVVNVAYTQTQKQYVDQVVLVFHKIDNKPWQLWDVKLTGDRLLKGGARGAETKMSNVSPRSLEGRSDWAWLAEIVNFFTPED